MDVTKTINFGSITADPGDIYNSMWVELRDVPFSRGWANAGDDDKTHEPKAAIELTKGISNGQIASVGGWQHAPKFVKPMVLNKLYLDFLLER